MSARPTDHTYHFRFTAAYRVAGALFGVTPASTSARLGPTGLEVRFGPWRVSTALGNIRELAVTGPYAFVKTAGPARLAITDRGLAFATNGEAGVRLRFVHPIRGIEPTGLLHHPELTLTVADPIGFEHHAAELIGSIAGPGRV